MSLRRYFVRRPVVPRPIVHATAGGGQAAAFPFHKVCHHRVGASPKRRTTDSPAALLSLGLSGALLVLVGAALASGLAPKKSSENVLHPAKASSKLITTSAQAAPVPEPPPPVLNQAPVLEEEIQSAPPPAVAVPTVPEPEPLAIVPQPAEPALVPVPEGPPPPVIAPAVDERPNAGNVQVAEMPATPPEFTDLWQQPLVFSQAHGETPMMRTWSMVKLASALAAALTVTPVAFAGDKEADAKEIKAILEKIEKRLEKLEKVDLAEIVKSANTVLIEDLLAAKKDLVYQRKWLENLSEGLKATAGQLDNLEKKVQKLAQDVDGKNVTALYPSDKIPLDVNGKLDLILERLARLHEKVDERRAGTSPAAGVDPLAPVGDLELVNSYSEELVFLVNGQRYSVQPGQVQVVRRFPAGSVTYHLMSPSSGRIWASRNSTLAQRGKLRLIATFP